jgi:hypothetical protein
MSDQNNETASGKNWRPNVNRQVSLFVQPYFKKSLKAMNPARNELDKIAEAKKALERIGVLRSERLTAEIGEHIANELFGYERARTSSNKGWDLLSGRGEKIQVKAHAKGPSNRCSTTFIRDFELFDVLVIVVMTSDYRIKVIYRMPKAEAEKRATIKPKDRRYELAWKRCEEFRVTPYNYPHPIWDEIGAV